jgi:flagellar motor component MotA
MIYLMVFLTLISFVGAISYSGNFLIFVDIPSILIVFLPTLFITMGKFGVTFFKNMNNEVYDTIGVSALYSGVIGFLIGLVQMLRAMNDPKHIGPAFAVALLTFFYASLIYLFSYSFKSNE